MSVRLLLIEFNEITPSLLQRFMAAGDLPNFRRFFDASSIYTTYAGDMSVDLLEPWIHWPTVHSGVPFEEHQVRYLGDGRAIPQPGIAALLSDAGIRVGVFGAMNANYEHLNGYYLPDPWDAHDLVQPQSLRPFYDFVAKQVQENTKDGGTTVADALRFARFMLGHGISIPTIMRVVAQLVGERFRPGIKWKRAPILDLMQYDLFRTLNRRHDVEFASFFSNSTAHLQHYYWRNMDPTGFRVDVPSDDDASLRSAVRFGYRNMDALLGAMTADNPNALLILCSALSQQPWFETTKCTYRPHDFSALLRFSGVAGADVVPVMAERFRVECATDEDAQRVAAALTALTCDGTPFMGVEVGGTTVYSGCDLYDADPSIFERTVVAADGRRASFGDLFYRITAMNSGQHHPDGVLWIRNGSHRVAADRIHLTAIAPMILAHFGLKPPASMRDTERLKQPA